MAIIKRYFSDNQIQTQAFANFLTMLNNFGLKHEVKYRQPDAEVFIHTKNSNDVRNVNKAYYQCFG